MNKKLRSDAKLTKQLRIVLNSDFDKREGKVQSRMNRLKVAYCRRILRRKFYRYYTNAFCDFLLDKLRYAPDKRRMHFTILEYRSFGLDQKLLTIGLYDSKCPTPLFYDDVSFKTFARGFPHEEYFMKLFPINNMRDFISIIWKSPSSYTDSYQFLYNIFSRKSIPMEDEICLLLKGMLFCECNLAYNENYTAEPSYYLSITSLF